jgi:anti-sigma regulatory factor (Ser/Thr protein kinase)
MPTEPFPWSLTIPSDLRLLALARAFVEAVCQVAGMDDAATHAVVLATDEATNNVMRHAHRGQPDKLLIIQCRTQPGEIELRLHDEGPPFDLDAVPKFDPGELRPGGRGVFIMRKVMDEVDVLPRQEGGNVLRMVKRFQPRQAPA